MSVMGPDGKILQPGGGWWSPYGNTDEEIKKNLKTGNMPNAPDAMRAGPRHFTGTKKGDAYCARSAGIKKCKNPPCANTLSRKKWKCRGKKSMKE